MGQASLHTCATTEQKETDLGNPTVLQQRPELTAYRKTYKNKLNNEQNHVRLNTVLNLKDSFAKREIDKRIKSIHKAPSPRIYKINQTRNCMVSRSKAQYIERNLQEKVK